MKFKYSGKDSDYCGNIYIIVIIFFLFGAESSGFYARITDGVAFMLKNKFKILSVVLCIVGLGGSFSSEAYSLFIDGQGYYAAKGEVVYKPGFSQHSYKGMAHSVSLLGKVTASEKLSLNVRFSLFKNPTEGYFGNEVLPQRCSKREEGALSSTGEASEEDCSGAHQDSLNPGYRNYVPLISEAFVEYASDYCILQIGRRARHWGMGAVINDGKAPFSYRGSIYDGISCEINPASFQNFGFSFGYDVLADRGSSYLVDDAQQVQGAFNNGSDNLRQVFVSVNSGNKVSEPGADFIHDIGLYFAWISGSGDTSIKLADLYTMLKYKKFSFENELVFRLGSSKDPSLVRVGGIYSTTESDEANKVTSIGLVGALNFTLHETGSLLAPEEFKKSDYTAHVLSLNYVYAPGDSDGAYPSYKDGEAKRDAKAEAMSFNPNYKPALILFNSPFLSDMRVDGIYDPNALMNVKLVSLGYKYTDVSLMDIGVKFIGAWLNKTAGSDAATYYTEENRPVVGMGGKKVLGYELDLSFFRNENKYLSYGADIGVCIPGKAIDLPSGGKKATVAVQLSTIFSI